MFNMGLKKTGKNRNESLVEMPSHSIAFKALPFWQVRMLY
jgi:hypothetical protein